MVEGDIIWPDPFPRFVDSEAASIARTIESQG